MDTHPRRALPAAVARMSPPRRVLVAEDDRRFRDLLAMTLSESFGVDVDTVSDGAKALARVQTELPALLLLDCNMPMVDGLSVLREVKRTHPQVPVVVMSGADNYAAATGLGCDEYLTKPFTWKELDQTLCRWLSVKV